MHKQAIAAHEKLRFVDHLSLEDLACFFEQQAKLCRIQASNQNSISEGEKQAAAMDFILQTPRIVMRHLNKGHTLANAKELTAKNLNLPTTTIAGQ